MSDFSPYGYTESAAADRVTATSMAGDPIGAGTVNAMGGPAFLSTAPYKPPRHEKVWFGCIGRDSTCRSRPIIGTDRCWFHTPKDDGEPPAVA